MILSYSQLKKKVEKLEKINKKNLRLKKKVEKLEKNLNFYKKQNKMLVIENEKKINDIRKEIVYTPEAMYTKYKLPKLSKTS